MLKTIQFLRRPAGPLTRRVPLKLTCGLVLALAVCGAVALQSTAAAEPGDSEQTIGRFIESQTQADQLSDQQRKQVLEIATKLRKDPTARDRVITECLRVISTEFATALDALNEKKIDQAVSGFAKLSSDSDLFLAAESSFFLARAYVASDRFEQALPLLQNVTGKLSDHTLHAGEATYLRGVAESALLKRKEAGASFTEFLERFPDAPARMRAAAERQLQLLEELVVGSFDDVHERMEFSSRRLGQQDSGKQTQQVQENIVALLTSLVEEMEKQGGQ